MRTEVKLGLVVVLVVVVATGLWWYSRPGEEAQSVPFSGTVMEKKPAENVTLAGDRKTEAVRPRPSAAPQASKTKPEVLGPARHPTPTESGAVRTEKTEPLKEIAKQPSQTKEEKPAAPDASQSPPTLTAKSDQPEQPAAGEHDSPPAVAREPDATWKSEAAADRPTLDVRPAPGPARRTPSPPAEEPRRTSSTAEEPSRSTGALQPAPPTVRGKPYTIQEGDRLIDVARQFYDDGRLWRAIKAANPNLEENHLRIGQNILVPDKDEAQRLMTASGTSSGGAAAADAKRDSTVGVQDPARDTPPPAGKLSDRHVVAAGDTLVGLARRLLNDENRWREIYELNKDQLDSPDHITVGTELKLPPKSAGGRK